MQCSATKRSGEQCGNHAVTGATVCRMHGGSAPQVKAKAQTRAARMQAHQAAERMVARAGVDVDPIEHLLESLHRAAALVEVWGTMVAALDARAADEAWERDESTLRGELGYEVDPDRPYSLAVRSKDRLLALNSKGMATIHPYVAEYNQALDRRARIAKLCIDAGVAERQVLLAEQQGQLLVQVIRGVLVDLGVADRPEAPAVVRKHLALVAS